MTDCEALQVLQASVGLAARELRSAARPLSLHCCRVARHLTNPLPPHAQVHLPRGHCSMRPQLQVLFRLAARAKRAVSYLARMLYPSLECFEASSRRLVFQQNVCRNVIMLNTMLPKSHTLSPLLRAAGVCKNKSHQSGKETDRPHFLCRFV